MGSVKLETRNEGRGLHEYDYVCLGEAWVVEKLILSRSKIDASYLAGQDTMIPMDTSGVFAVLEP